MNALHYIAMRARMVPGRIAWFDFSQRGDAYFSAGRVLSATFSLKVSLTSVCRLLVNAVIHTDKQCQTDSNRRGL
jgi:hypothetical protein